MKKLVALCLAMMIALVSMSAFADNVYTKVAIDPEVAANLLSSYGFPESQMGMVEPIIALVNALGVNVRSVSDGTQLDFDLNGTDAFNVGVAVNNDGFSVVSTLFPNYLVTMSQETVAQLMTSMPGVSNMGSMDTDALMGIFYEYVMPWISTLAVAGKPGQPEMGQYEIEGYTFDTMVPVTVDMNAIIEATKTQVDGLLADPEAMAIINSIAQSYGIPGNVSLEKEIKAGLDEWMTHFPESVKAEYYSNSNGTAGFYLISEAVLKDQKDSLILYMLYADIMNMSVGIQFGKDIEAGFVMEDTSIGVYYKMGDMYYGVALKMQENQYTADVYVNNTEKPLVNVAVRLAEGGERTLPVDAEGKTVLSIEEVMNDASGKAAQGIMGDIMGNGLNTLMNTVGTEVPEFANLMNMFIGGGM